MAPNRKDSSLQGAPVGTAPAAPPRPNVEISSRDSDRPYGVSNPPPDGE